jgi:hypothetical protein
MGIRFLLSWLRENFGDCFEALRLPPPSSTMSAAPNAPHTYTSLYVDFNAILYQCVSQEQARRAASHGSANNSNTMGREAAVASFEADVLTAVVNAMDAVVVNVLRPTLRKGDKLPEETPTLTIFIAVDGVSPHGKTAQQRNRRALKSASRIVQLGGGVEWDMSAITPGTALMLRVAATLEWYALSRVRQWTNVCITVSDSSVPGEGEHKIFTALRQEATKHGSVAPSLDGVKGTYGGVCICSNDTDVVLGAALLVDDPTFRRHGMDVLRCDVSDPSSLRASNAIFNVQKFRRSLCSKYGWTEWHVDVDEASTEADGSQQWTAPQMDGFTDAFRDMLFVFLLFGNDFVPKLPTMDIAAGSLDAVMDFLVANFISRHKHIIDPTTFTVDLASAQYLISEVVRLSKTHRILGLQAVSDAARDQASGPARKQHRTEGLSVFLAPGATSDEWESHPQRGSTTARMEQLCAAYWDGLQWTARYYSGRCTAWRWHYPFDDVPSEEALCHSFSAMLEQPSPPLLPLTQMLLVLQGQARSRLLPRAVVAALEDEDASNNADNGDAAQTDRDRNVHEACVELSKPIHSQSVDLLDTLTAAFSDTFSAEERAQLRVSQPYCVLWNLSARSTKPAPQHQPLQQRPIASTQQQPPVNVFEADEAIMYFVEYAKKTKHLPLPGLAEGDSAIFERLAKLHAVKATNAASIVAATTDVTTPVASAQGHLTIAGFAGSRVENLPIADKVMRATGTMPPIINSLVRAEGRTAKAVFVTADLPVV